MSYNCPSTSTSCPSYSTSQSGQSPCCTAQMVDQSCGQSYTLSTSNFQESLYIPNATTANYATCSWASYNLLSACAACLGQSTWASWATYSANCGNYVSSTTYFPWDQGCRLPDNGTFPFFAATNPIYWSDGTFNVNEASANGSSVAPDVTGAPLTSPSSTAASGSSSSSSGAIIGGVVGALAVVGLAGFILCYMVRRRRRQAQDRSAFQSPIPQSHTSMIQTVTSPTGLTSNPSSHEFSNATPHPVFFSSITTTSLRSPITTDAADVITPFISPPTRPMPTSTKATEALVRRSESPQRRGRMNPPPYSPTAPAGSSSTPSPPPTKHPRRSKKLIRHVATGSVDTVATTTEADSAPPRMPPPTKPSHHPEARPQAVEMHSADSGSGSRGSDGRKTSEVEGVGFTRRYDGQKGTRASRNRPPAV